ncbi:MAG: aspartyl protease family protein [Bacteroidetes bacterium]|nr:aspartyl protease family protein [Bacteroidota bacterium]
MVGKKQRGAFEKLSEACDFANANFELGRGSFQRCSPGNADYTVKFYPGMGIKNYYKNKHVSTVRYGMRMPFLEKEIQILYPKKGTQIACKALWDTGANASMITRHVVEALGLEVLSYTDVTGIHGTERRPVYSITLVLADSVIFERTKVIGYQSLGRA